MLRESCLERVIIIPRNGYINRIQAWASASLLAGAYEISAEVLWEPEFVAPASAETLFDESLVRSTFLRRHQVDQILGQDHENLKRYLTCLRERGIAILAGHDLGEQIFMDEIVRIVTEENWLRVLIIIAGGKFTIGPQTDFPRERRGFYNKIAWSDAINQEVSTELAGRASFNALHIRETDHARNAPNSRQILRALGQLKEASATNSLFIAADNASARERWSEISRELGFEPWSTSPISMSRESALAGHAALVDWRILSSSNSIIYSSISSFAEEASIAAGCVSESYPLNADPLTRLKRDLRTWSKLGTKRLLQRG